MLTLKRAPGRATGEATTAGLAMAAAALLLAASSHAAPRSIHREGTAELPITSEIRDGVEVFHKVILSPPLPIDGIYRSMEGAVSIHPFRLRPQAAPKLMWVTGYQATMVAPDGSTPLSQEFMCHSNLDTPPRPYARRFPSALAREQEVRLFTLAQGQLSIELPRGFGMPLMSNATLNLQSQVLNHNLENANLGVRHRIAIDFVRDMDLAKPMIPLLPVPVFAMKLVEGETGHYGIAAADIDPEIHGEGCLPGDTVPGAAEHPDDFGRVFTGHWKVKKGREKNHTLVTDVLKLPYDTTIHYIAAHLHPFAKYLELVDITAGKSVYRTNVRNLEGRIGLAEVAYYSSVEGLPLYKDHQYEIVSVYDNPTEFEHTAMAGFFLYLRAHDLEDTLSATRAGSRVDE